MEEVVDTAQREKQKLLFVLAKVDLVKNGRLRSRRSLSVRLSDYLIFEWLEEASETGTLELLQKAH